MQTGKVGMHEDRGQDRKGDTAPAAVGTAGREPFGETVDPTLHVPREATERALDALEDALRRSAGVLLLTAPPGLGKTHLLQVACRRLRPRVRSVLLAYGSLAPEDLCAWALGLLGEDTERATGEAALEALLSLARHEHAEGGALLLVVDDANSLPLATARRLAALVAEGKGALRLLLAATDDARTSRLAAALGTDLCELRFTAPMTEAETRDYVLARLERAGTPPDLRSRFDDDAIAGIHRLSRGIPRRVHEVANPVLHAMPEHVRPAWRELRWLGTPIDDASAALSDVDADLAEAEAEPSETEESSDADGASPDLLDPKR
jgi:type II secretory pathway predicted ATPase ExeA